MRFKIATLNVSILILLTQIQSVQAGLTPTVRGQIFESEKSLKEAPLFTFERRSDLIKPNETVEREYKDPSGKVALLEKAKYENGRITKFELIQNQLNERGAFEVKENRIYFRYQKNGKWKEDDEKLKDNTVVSDEVIGLIRKNWDTIMAGEKINMRYAVLDRLETVGFDIFLESKSKWKGKDAVILKMKPSSIFISALVDPLYFTLTTDDKEIQILKGRVTPKIKSGSDWDDLDGATLYQVVEKQEK